MALILYTAHRKPVVLIGVSPGSHFDFMLSWKDFNPSSSELKDLLNIVDKEIKVSKELEEMIFNSRNKNRKKIHSLHKLLIAK